MDLRNLQFSQCTNSNVGVVQRQNQSTQYNAESDLDLEYAMTLTDPTPVTLLQTGDLIQGEGVGSCDECITNVSPELVGAGFDNWLDAVDASFCGGDDPDQVCINLHAILYMLLTSRFQDGIYPDHQKGGYNRTS